WLTREEDLQQGSYTRTRQELHMVIRVTLPYNRPSSVLKINGTNTATHCYTHPLTGLTNIGGRGREDRKLSSIQMEIKLRRRRFRQPASKVIQDILMLT
ncbi:hypothetical protein M8C21_016597, partial [Ambrosia artemisiifolia]